MNGEKKGIEEKIARYLPSVKKPTYQQTFNEKLKWTLAALFAYLILSYVTVSGIEKASYEQFRFFEVVLGSKFGSIMTLGIGPIVTAGIVMQLLVGSKIINWDLTKAENRKKFQTWNKLLAILFSFLEAFALVLAGTFQIKGGMEMAFIVISQLAAGGIIALLLDDLVTKWGFGSGISLFIAGGVANQIIIRIFSPLSIACIPANLASCLPSSEAPPSGLLWQFFINSFSGKLIEAFISALPIITTLLIFFLVAFIQGIGIDIPLTFSRIRGFGRTWTMKLLYTSNIPVILAGALVANLQLMAGIGTVPSGELRCSLLACFDSQNRIVSGIVYYLTSPQNFIGDVIQGIITSNEIIRAFTYLIFFSLVAMIFSVFWVSTAGMDASSVATQLESSGLQIPGYRSDKKSMEIVLNRYIPYLAFLGGIIIGMLAAVAELLGVIGGGTGILLTVMILYDYYQRLSAENLEGAHPFIRKILGE